MPYGAAEAATLRAMASPAFEAAKAELEASDAQPDNMQKLALYGLFKQATVGDVSGKRPGLTDFVGRAKYDAWAGRTGMTTEQAEQAYIAEVATILGR